MWRVTTALEITLNMSPGHVHKGISVLMARPSHTNSLVHQGHTTTEHDGQGYMIVSVVALDSTALLKVCLPTF